MLTLNQFIEQAKQYTVVPVTVQILADQHTPVSLLQRFYPPQKNGVFLFESIEGGEKWGRYSFIGINAHSFITVQKETVEVKECDSGSTSLIEHHGKPLETLRELMKHYRSGEHPELPRFFGGLVGYFAYEMVSFFENIPNKTEDSPFASFVIPKTLLIFDNVKQVLTVCVTVFPKKDAKYEELYRNAVDEIQRVKAELEKPFAAQPPQCSADLMLTPVISEQEYRKRVAAIKEHIRSGDMIQCVFSQQFVADDAPDAVSLYRALRFFNPAPYLFFMHLGETILVGSSPETMVRLEGRTATLRPIAGTRKRGQTEQRDRELADEMLRDPKEKAEHLMLVDLGRNDLGRIAKTGTVQVTDLMFIERHSHVMHLVSNVTAQIEDAYDGFDLFRAAFPAGTLSGAPKVRAMQIIAEQETTPRGPYGGAAGYIAYNGNIDFAITIRTACIRNGKLTAQSGGGIVFDSVPELEYKETVNKAMGIAKALTMLETAAF
ncbi:MAG: chorismate-binding protein [Planctomycetaceae bacterium]|jgi:anthranilate synthase component 1|nr:chorismate-binding protein [Planctomycetaceae bacterium]